jgi:predicted DsbA family dithiol-disulfide isomerase
MHDLLIHNQDRLGAPDPERHAQDLGLDVERFRNEMRRRVHAPRVAEDVASADESGVAGTPGFFINGRRHRGAYDVDTLTGLVRAARGRASAQAAQVPAEGEPVS